MKKQRFREEQIIAVLKEQEAGAKVAEFCRKHGISDATFYNWKAKYGGKEVSEAKRLKALEEENAKLKKLLAEQMLEEVQGLRSLHQKAVIGRFDRTGYGFFRRPETQKAPRGGFNGHTGIFWLRGPDCTESCTTWYLLCTKSERIAQDATSQKDGLPPPPPTHHSVSAVVSLEINAFRMPFCVCSLCSTIAARARSGSRNLSTSTMRRWSALVSGLTSRLTAPR